MLYFYCFGFDLLIKINLEINDTIAINKNKCINTPNPKSKKPTHQMINNIFAEICNK